MDPLFLLPGLALGGVTTFTMLAVEIPVLRKFGLRGVFEWHEIAAAVFRVRQRRALILPLHILAGAVAGLGFATVVSIVRFDFPLPFLWLGWGALLWLVTLGIHEPITQVHPWRNDMGKGPVAASLVGHLLYGAVLALMITRPP